MLFAQNVGGTISRTFKDMELFFRKVRRNARKRCGEVAAGNILSRSGVSLALYRKMDNRGYVRIVFGDLYNPSVFAGYRKPFEKNGITSNGNTGLADTGKKMILNSTLSSDRYSEKR